MHDHLTLFINGQRHEVRGDAAFDTLSDYLRLRCGLVGTKIVCSEGDCGACSVLVGRVEGERVVYRPIDSCIQFMFQLNGTHVVTVEGLTRNGTLSPVQDAMVQCHGSQCGFCTPGFVVAMTALFETTNGDAPQRLTDRSMREGLCGNLCRCTGYQQIMDAGRAVDPNGLARIGELYSDEPMLRQMRETAASPARIEQGERVVDLPVTLKDAVAFKAEHPDCRAVAGATDLGVRYNKRVFTPGRVLCLSSIGDASDVRVEDGKLVMGALATWTSIESVLRDALPPYHDIIKLFGSPQIRHAGTIGGNIANASPIADSLPCLFVMDASLELLGPTGTRTVKINDFYTGYKQYDLRDDELIASVTLPLPGEDEVLGLYKVSKRLDMDISSFTAGIWMRRSGDTIQQVRIAYGGVGPVVLRLPKTEALLTGKTPDEAMMREAGGLARSEITPITDVRGSSDFRLRLAENILLKFFAEHLTDPALT